MASLFVSILDGCTINGKKCDGECQFRDNSYTCNVAEEVHKSNKFQCSPDSRHTVNNEVSYRISPISARAYYLKNGNWKPEIRGEINSRAYGENKKQGENSVCAILFDNSEKYGM